MRKSWFAVVALGSLVLSAVAVAPAQAAQPTVTGGVSGGAVLTSGISVGWFNPQTGESGSTVTRTDGSYSLTPTSTPFVLFENLSYVSGEWKRVDARYLGKFFGPPSFDYSQGGNFSLGDYLYQGLAPFTSLPQSTVVNLQLMLPGTITGLGAPLATPDETIDLFDTGDSHLASALVGSDRSFTFTGLAPGNYVLRGYPTRYHGSWTQSVTLTAQSMSATITPSIPKSAILSGQVTSKGKPVAGVVVSVVAGGSFGGDTVTNKNGRYILHALDAGRVTLSVGGAAVSTPGSSEGLVSGGSPGAVQRQVKVSLKAGVKTIKNVSVVRGAAVTTKLALTKGATSYQVALLDSAGKIVQRQELESTKNNTVSFFGLGRGAYKLVATDSNNTRFASKTVRVLAGKTLQLGTTVLSRRTVRLTGSITGGTGKTVMITTKTVTRYATVHAGSFSVTGLVPGRMTVTVFGKGVENATRSVSIRTSAKKKFPVGQALVPVSGTMTAAGYPVRATGEFVNNKSSNSPLSGEASSRFSVNKGVLAGEAPRGKSSVGLDYLRSPFVEGTPYWLSLPSTSSSISVGATAKDLGAIALVLHS